MKVKIMDIHKIEKGSKELPIQFYEPVREDLIQRAVLSIEASEQQPYGMSPMSGMRHVVWISKRRRDYKGSYGHGLSRVPRKIMSRSGTQFNWVGSGMSGTVGGKTMHPPKSSKILNQKINDKENKRAISSAIAATMSLNLIKARGHRLPKEFPFIVDNKIELLSKTKDVYKALEQLGFEQELERIKNINVRAGKGKNRGRKHQHKTGPLFVVSKDCPLLKSAKNIQGIDVVSVNSLNAKILAPGCHPGRLTLWSDAAIDVLAAQNLYTEHYKGETIKKQVKVEVPKAIKQSKEVKKTVKTEKPAAKKPAKESTQ